MITSNTNNTLIKQLTISYQHVVMVETLHVRKSFISHRSQTYMVIQLQQIFFSDRFIKVNLSWEAPSGLFTSCHRPNKLFNLENIFEGKYCVLDFNVKRNCFYLPQAVSDEFYHCQLNPLESQPKTCPSILTYFKYGITTPMGCALIYLYMTIKSLP